jgi:hypothetical protein
MDGELRVGIKPFGLPDHQLIGGIWSTQSFTSLAQDPRTLIPIDSIIRGEISLRDALSEVQIGEMSGSWAVYYNFDQFLYTTKSATTCLASSFRATRSGEKSFTTSRRRTGSMSRRMPSHRTGGQTSHHRVPNRAAPADALLTAKPTMVRSDISIDKGDRARIIEALSAIYRVL